MQIEQRQWNERSGWYPETPAWMGDSAKVVFIFGSRKTLQNRKVLAEVMNNYPKAIKYGCSTSGEIRDINVNDDSLVTTAVNLENSEIEMVKVDLRSVEGDSYRAGVSLAKSMSKDDLVHVFVISDGLKINGSQLCQGLGQNLPDQVSVTGGLAGDGANFEETLVITNDITPIKNSVMALGFHGKNLKVGYGSAGGWDPFGPERLVTRSKDNILFELDGHSALELYKNYLGEHAQGLPATGLLFPLSIKVGEKETELVRTILSINEKEQSLTFAGDIPQRVYARLMKANFDRLIDGAINAAKMSVKDNGCSTPDLALLISCVGRKLVLKQRVEEEVEGVREVFGEKTTLTGFYSYGEICPPPQNGKCELHNQTMTITTFTEK